MPDDQSRPITRTTLMGWITDQAPTRAELNSCVQCGLCLPECPTFRLTGKETFSPRGRLMAMSAVADGVVDVDESFAAIMDSCLQCRACEVVCPSLVPFGRAMEGARAELSAQLPGSGRRVRELIVGRVLASSPLMKLATGGIRVVQKLGLRRMLPPAIRIGFEGIRPIKPIAGGRGTTYPALGERIGRAGFLTGCVMDVWFSEVHAASIALLQRAGYDVVISAAQTCCGALAAHDGAVEATERLAKRNIVAFANVDVIAVDSAGCGAHLKEYGNWAGEPGEAMSRRVFDITELIAMALTDGRLRTSEVARGRVAIQDPCHLRHVQRIVEQPRAILRAAGYEPVQIDPDGRCCGAAGLYSVLQPELSRELGSAKAVQVRAAQVTVVASANPGCEMQLRGHLGSGYEIVHPVELLWRALQEDDR